MTTSPATRIRSATARAAFAHGFVTAIGTHLSLKCAAMRNAALLSFSLFVLSVAGAPSVAAAARMPVVVELYTAQGCGSCGEANAHVAKLAERPGVLALTFPVDYWDYLGWTDTFAKPEFAARQKAYVGRLELREPYTPEVIIDGRVEAPGLKSEQVDKLVRDAAKAPRSGPDVRFINARRVDVGSARAPRGGAEVWLIRYDPREQGVTVKSGDNRGETIVQRNVVREARLLGYWRGRPAAYRMPPPSEDGLRSVVLVQAGRGGRIVGVGQSKAAAPPPTRGAKSGG